MWAQGLPSACPLLGAVLPIPPPLEVQGARAGGEAYSRDQTSCVGGCHANTQPMEGVVSPQPLSLRPPDQSSPQIWGLCAAPSACLQGLVTLMALVASARMRPHRPNQLKGEGSDVSVSSGEGSGCRVRGPDAASSKPMYGKGAAGTGGSLPGGVVSLPPGSLSIAQPGPQGQQEVKEGKGVVTPMQPALRLETPPLRLGLARAKCLGADHSWLPQSRGSLLQGLGNCMTQGRTWIKECGLLVAPPNPAILLLSLLSLCQCLYHRSPGEPSSFLIPSPAIWVPVGSEAGHAVKGGSYLFGRGMATAQPQCNRLQLKACFALF